MPSCKKNKKCCTSDIQYHKVLNKNGFTLAEVLITLGVIGVVAALTLPSVINDYNEKKNIATWKKAYAEFAQVAQKISYDYNVNTFEEAIRKQEEIDNLTPSGDLVTQPVINLFSKYFKNINMACNGTKCEFAGNEMSGWACTNILVDGYVSSSGLGKSTGYKYLSGADAGYWVLGYYPTVCAQTPSYTFALDTNTSSYGRISIDVNGKKKPNVIGKDIFVLNMNNLNQVVPGGSNGFYSTKDYECDSNAKYGGPACSAEYLQK